MANYFSEACFNIDKLTDEEMDWLHKVQDTEFREQEMERMKMEDIDHITVPMQLIREKRVANIASDDANLTDIAIFVQLFLKVHRPDERFAFEVAHTADKLLLDSCGGTAVLISADDIEVVSTGEITAKFLLGGKNDG